MESESNWRLDLRRLRLPRRTVRLRLTLLYLGLFLVSGAVLLGITYTVTQTRSGGGSVSSSAGSGITPGGVPPSGVPGEHCTISSSKTLCKSFSEGREAALSQLPAASAIALGCMVVFSAGLGWVVAGRVLRPLQDITQAARRISADNLHSRLAMEGPDDELKDLGDTIDDLLARLESAFESQRRFVANASHELRTPLAMMRTSLDVAMAKPEPISPQLQALAPKLRAGLSRAETLLESLLVLAWADRGSLPEPVTVSLAELAWAALGARAEAAVRMHLQVRHEIGDAWVRGSSTLLARMVENLVDNAVRHNQAGGWLQVHTGTVEGRALLVVENGGHLLPPDQVRELAEPFRRIGGDRLGRDGYGLGLSIVAAIASAHGGSLDLTARAEGGLRVVVDLPAVAPFEVGTVS
ncbi:MAG TPA: HAMP domain-containing sensor histidine kinase [Candidatus Dormibacteraeota bacterium]|jgi:hypothetical protein|nr:HAMP domain-containing sensor histidine kinase [Candidatus Dormibacteraeota bacterium]